VIRPGGIGYFTRTAQNQTVLITAAPIGVE
jgi:hypothetical protein